MKSTESLCLSAISSMKKIIDETDTLMMSCDMTDTMQRIQDAHAVTTAPAVEVEGEDITALSFEKLILPSITPRGNRPFVRTTEPDLTSFTIQTPHGAPPTSPTNKRRDKKAPILFESSAFKDARKKKKDLTLEEDEESLSTITKSPRTIRGMEETVNVSLDEDDEEGSTFNTVDASSGSIPFTVAKPEIEVVPLKPLYSLAQQEEDVKGLALHVSQLKAALEAAQLFIPQKLLLDTRRGHKVVMKLGTFKARRGSTWSTTKKLQATELLRDCQDVFRLIETKSKEQTSHLLTRALKLKERGVTLGKDMEKLKKELARTTQRADETYEHLEDMLMSYFEFRMNAPEEGATSNTQSVSKKPKKALPKFMNVVDIGIQAQLDEDEMPKQMRKLVLISHKESVIKSHVVTIRAAVNEIVVAQSRLDLLLRCGVCSNPCQTSYMMFPCGHCHCESCQNDSIVDLSTQKCIKCGIYSQDRAVPISNINSTIAKANFMKSGFNDMNCALEKFVGALGSIEKNVLVREIKMLSEEIFERFVTKL
jgi:hypothetical protein